MHVVSVCWGEGLKSLLAYAENAEAMQEDLKEQPCMIERLYGKVDNDG